MPRASAASASSRAVSSSGGAGSVRASSASAPKREAGGALDPLGARVEGAAIDLDDAVGEQIEQPLGLDARARDGWPARARRCRAPPAGLRSRRRRPPPASRRPARTPARRCRPRRAGPSCAPGSRRRATRSGKAASTASRSAASRRRRAVGPVAPARPSIAEASWRRTRPDLLDRAAVELQPAQRVGAEARGLRLAKEIDQIDEVGAAIGPPSPAAGPAANDGARAARMSRSLIERGGQRRAVAGAARLPLDDQAREARMDREAQHAPADVGEIAGRGRSRPARASSSRAAPQAAAGGASSQASASASPTPSAASVMAVSVRSARAISGRS